MWKDKWMGILDIYMLANAVSSKQIFFKTENFVRAAGLL